MENKILLSRILNILPSEMPRWKLRFNKYGSGTSAKKHYLLNNEGLDFDKMTLWCTKKSMLKQGNILIGLAKLSYNQWLLVKIYEILDENPTIKDSADRYSYKVEEQYKPFFGRVILKVNSNRALTYPVQSLTNIEKREEFEVCEILDSEMQDEGFCGYDNVCLSFLELERIVTKGQRDWIYALSNQKGVYVITDKANGKLYIGSATSENGMLLARWSDYIHSGHGGNKLLKALIKEKGLNYIKHNFQYSIIENYNAKISDEVILRRERYWKKVLQSYTGYNDN